MTRSATIGMPPSQRASCRAIGRQTVSATVGTHARQRTGHGQWLALVLALVALVLSGRAHATCTNTNNPGTVTFSPPGGQITLSSTGVGIGTVVWTSAQAVPANYPTLTCTGNTNNGIVNIYGPPMGSDATLFPTNLSWLSFRILHPDTSNPLSTYPSNAPIPAGTYDFSVASALQLVVTGTIPAGQQGTTQQMTIPSGQLAQWNLDMTGGSKPVEIFKITNINFVIPTCTAAVDPTVVTLPPVSTSQLTGKGTIAGQLPFQVQLNCISGSNLRITLSTASAYSTNHGVINNTTGPGYATNVGVQLLEQDGTTPVKFGTAISESTTQNGTMNLLFYAQYYQTSSSNVTAGQVSATATYTLTYQ